jgi:NADH-quinone oxidoreductase subunit J
LFQQGLLNPILLFAACVLGALGVGLALPRRGLNPQLIGVLIAGLGLGVFFMWLGSRTRLEGLPNPNFYLFAAVALGASLRVISEPRPVYAALCFILTILASCGMYVLLSAEFMAFALVIVYAGAILITYLFVIMLATESPTAEQVEALNEYDRYSREPVIGTVLGFVLLAATIPMLVRGTEALPEVRNYADAARIEQLPRRVETTLRRAGVIAADQSLAYSGEGADRSPLIESDPKTGQVIAVTVAYGQGQTARLTSDAKNWPADLKLTNTEGVGFALLADHPGAIEVAGVILLMAMLGAVVLARKKVELDDREKLLAQARLLASEFNPERSPLLAPETPGAPNVRETELAGAGTGAVAGRERGR